MAEQKKERAKAAPRKTATKRKTTTSSRTVKTNKSDKAPKIRKEVRGHFYHALCCGSFAGDI